PTGAKQLHNNRRFLNRSKATPQQPQVPQQEQSNSTTTAGSPTGAKQLHNNRRFPNRSKATPQSNSHSETAEGP
ncbi:MAG: hypothetical protein AB8H12_15790, partial [Lewinella sp.]